MQDEVRWVQYGCWSWQAGTLLLAMPSATCSYILSLDLQRMLLHFVSL